MKKRENLTSLADLHKGSMYTDFVLLISDEADPYKTTLFQIETHRLILYACSEYFVRCFSFGGASSIINTLCLALNFADGLTEEIVRLFFRLFYVTRFDAKHLDALMTVDGTMTLADAIQCNIFFLYQLALRFHFNPLVEYCEAVLFESWGLEYFAHLCRFCLIKNSVTGRYAIIDERLKLYARFLQWYQCCVEVIPYSPLLTSEEETPSKRRYLSCQKDEILREHLENVDNIAACRIPSKTHYNMGSRAMRLTYYRKICASCLFTHDKKHSYEGFYLINFGALKKHYANGYEQYFFRLKRRIRSSAPLDDNVLELTLCRTYYTEGTIECENRLPPEKHARPRRSSATKIRLLIEDTDSCSETGEAISVEGEEEAVEEEEKDTVIENKATLEQMPLLPNETTSKYRCRTQLTLLSKKVETDEVQCEYGTRDFALPTEISRFSLHTDKWCYSGHCDTCRHHKPIYIIQMDIHLERDDSHLFFVK